MIKNKRRINLFKKILSISGLSLLIMSYQNCSQTGPWSKTTGSQSDQASSGGSSNNDYATNYPAKSVEQLQSTCSIEKDTLEPSVIRPLSSFEYIATIRNLTGNGPVISPITDPILDTIPIESSGDSISTYMRFSDSRAFFSDDNIAGFHRIALAIADAVESSTGSANEISYIQRLFHGCYNGSGVTETCIDTMVNTLGRRAFRRPLTSDQFTTVKTLMGSGAAEARLSKAAYYFLMSPNFLIHLEDQGTVVNGVLTLDQYGLASKISFFIAGMGPSDTLLDLAANNQLGTEAQIKSAVDQVYAQSYWQVRGQMERFLNQWLGLKSSVPSSSAKMIAIASPTYASIPTWGLYYGLNQEIRNMFMYYLTGVNGTYADFFTNEKMFSDDDDVSKIYGLPKWDPKLPWYAGSTPATHPSRQRAGFLTTATMLMSRGEMTNPFAVGGNIYKHVLCRQFGNAALPNFQPALDPNDSASLLTTRERFEKLVPRGSSCMKCHSQIEGFGMPMQDYDAFGRHRGGFEKIFDDAGNFVGTKPVDTYGTVEIGGSMVQVRSGVDLVQQLAKTTEPQSCFAREIVRFANARIETRKDSCQVSRLAKNLTTQSMWEAIKSYIADPAFAKRRLN